MPKPKATLIESGAQLALPFLTVGEARELRRYAAQRRYDRAMRRWRYAISEAQGRACEARADEALDALAEIDRLILARPVQPLEMLADAYGLERSPSGCWRYRNK